MDESIARFAMVTVVRCRRAALLHTDFAVGDGVTGRHDVDAHAIDRDPPVLAQATEGSIVAEYAVLEVSAATYPILVGQQVWIETLEASVWVVVVTDLASERSP